MISTDDYSTIDDCDDTDSDNTVTIQEDETCYLLSIKMPNVNGKDVGISLKGDILTISGYRRRCYAPPVTNTFDHHYPNNNGDSSNCYEKEYNNNDMNIDTADDIFSPPRPLSPSSSDSELDDQQEQIRTDHHHHANHHRRHNFNISSLSTKRQRLVNREFKIDTTAIDIDRAITNTWNGSLTLYAPKKIATTTTAKSITAELR